MFKFIFYGFTDKGLGILRTVKSNELNVNEIEFDDVLFIIVEDEKTHIKRYIFSLVYRSRIVKNNIDGFYKHLTIAGKKGTRSWVQIINYTDAEILSASPIHVLQMVQMIADWDKNGASFWKINNTIKEYSEKYYINCYTGKKIE